MSPNVVFNLKHINEYCKKLSVRYEPLSAMRRDSASSAAPWRTIAALRDLCAVKVASPHAQHYISTAIAAITADLQKDAEELLSLHGQAQTEAVRAL